MAMRKILSITLQCALLITSVAFAAPLNAQGVPIVTAGGGQIQVRVKSLADLRFRNMTRQSQDLSCGAAAVATLLRHAYNLEADEASIIDTIFSDTPPEAREKIAADGFSLLELKRYIETRGFAAGGFKLETAEKLANLQVPVIALVNVRGYNHFVVI